ncbi:MAG: indolepyruvate ferredoxin oxidoreductase family protein, partial [Serpentinimonas sp.]|nr:indolepyruvate ferredoxin oxidoreductase family protein [Serpentinimonas sp.]
EGDFALRFHLAPPLWARHDERGVPIKQSFGPWMLTAFKWLARLKGLRGSALDPFGRSAERRSERALIVQYQGLIEELLPGLSPERKALALQLAALPEGIKGFGHVKARNLQAVRLRWDELLGQWRASAQHQTAQQPAHTVQSAAPVQP